MDLNLCCKINVATKLVNEVCLCWMWWNSWKCFFLYMEFVLGIYVFFGIHACMSVLEPWVILKKMKGKVIYNPKISNIAHINWKKCPNMILKHENHIKGN